MGGQPKKRYRAVSDVLQGRLEAYGEVTGRKPRYVDFFGFWLNRKRILYRQARAVALGVGIANGDLKMGGEYYDAIADSPGEAQLLKAIGESGG